MNYTNSTLILDKKNNNSFFEGLGAFVAIITVCCIYFCYFTPSKEESERRFRWSVERAQNRIALRNELAQHV